MGAAHCGYHSVSIRFYQACVKRCFIPTPGSSRQGLMALLPVCLYQVDNCMAAVDPWYAAHAHTLSLPL